MEEVEIMFFEDKIEFLDFEKGDINLFCIMYMNFSNNIRFLVCIIFYFRISLLFRFNVFFFFDRFVISGIRYDGGYDF